jgi:hypothetical protein
MTDPATRSLLLETARYRCDVQRSALERVEAKSGILLAFTVTAAQFVVSRQVMSGYRSWALVCYGVSVGAALIAAAFIRAHREVDPIAFIPALWEAPALWATTELVNQFAAAYVANTARLRWRVRLWRTSAAMLAAGAMLSVLHLTRGTPA